MIGGFQSTAARANTWCVAISRRRAMRAAAYVAVRATDADDDDDNDDNDAVGLLRAAKGGTKDDGRDAGRAGSEVPTVDVGAGSCLPRIGAAREHRDTMWRNAYVLYATFVFAVCVMALASGDLTRLVEETNPTLMKTHAHCHPGEAIPDFALQNATITEHALGEVEKLNNALYGVMFGTAGFMFVSGALLLWMFQRHGKFMTWSVLSIYLLLITFSTIGFFVEGAVESGIVCAILLAIGLTYVITQRGREQIELISKLLQAAGQALAQNPHIFTVTIALTAAQVICVCFLLSSIGSLMYNGQVKSNPDETLTFIGPDAPVDGLKSQCYTTEEDGNEFYAPCCIWEPDSWTYPFLVLTYIFLLWTFALCMEIRTYITGGTVARWYFSDSTDDDFKGTTIDATKNALGASFGSLCFGSAIATVVDRVRKVCGSEGHHTWLGTLLSPVLLVIEEWTIFVTKYTTIRCAMSGERFYDAGVAVFRLVSNNLFSAFGIWLLPARLLGTLSFMFTGLWSVLMVAATSKVMQNMDWEAVMSIPGL